MDKVLKKGAFFTVQDDGAITDRGITDEMLGGGAEDRIRQGLIDNGVIKEIILVRKQKTLPRGVFYTVKDGKPTDKGIVDGMLDNEEEIHTALVESGIIKQYYVEDDNGNKG
jgi:hypothetical protein